MVSALSVGSKTLQDWPFWFVHGEMVWPRNQSYRSLYSWHYVNREQCFTWKISLSRQWSCKIKSDNPKAGILAVHLGSRRQVKGRQVGWNLDLYFNLCCYIPVILYILSPFYFTGLNKGICTELLETCGCLTSIPCNTARLNKPWK